MDGIVIKVDFDKRPKTPLLDPKEPAKVISLDERRGAMPSAARQAYDLYVRASQLDEDPKTYDHAEHLYNRAIHLDPSLAIAYTNLANIRFRRGDQTGAENIYRQALEHDPRQPEAHYNLGYLKLEGGDARGAIASFDHALDGDWRFADAHFNKAMALEQLGNKGAAKPHWRKYLELEPGGVWADVAREALDAADRTHAQRKAATADAIRKEIRSKREEGFCDECGYAMPGHDWGCSKVPKDAARPAKQPTLQERPPERLTLTASPGIVGEGKQLPGMAEWLAKQRKKG